MRTERRDIKKNLYLKKYMVKIRAKYPIFRKYPILFTISSPILFFLIKLIFAPVFLLICHFLKNKFNIEVSILLLTVILWVTISVLVLSILIIKRMRSIEKKTN